MYDDWERLKLYYEHGISAYYKELDLLFRRFNFFLFGMSFLFAAIAVMVTSDKTPPWAIPFLTFVGWSLSIWYFMVNFLMANEIRQLRDYVFRVEAQFPSGPQLLAPFSGAYPHLSPGREGKGENWWRRFTRNYLAHYTWLTPVGFAIAWSVVTLFTGPRLLGITLLVADIVSAYLFLEGKSRQKLL